MTNLQTAALGTTALGEAAHGLLTDLIAPRRAAAPITPSAPTPLPRAAAGYRILRAWQRALDVAALAHEHSAAFPAADLATLGADLRRAGAAVPAQIAAGNLAYDSGEHRRALAAAQTALARVETLALLAERLGLLPPADVAALLAASADTLRLVRGLARVALGAHPPKGSPSAVSEPAALLATRPARTTRARRPRPSAAP